MDERVEKALHEFDELKEEASRSRSRRRDNLETSDKNSLMLGSQSSAMADEDEHSKTRQHLGDSMHITPSVLSTAAGGTNRYFRESQKSAFN